MNPKLKETIKGILEAPPIDLYNEESASSLESSLELVNPREEIREIGSANVFTAIILATLIKLNEVTARPLTEDEVEIAESIWDDLVITLKRENFIRSKPEFVKESLKLIVNNEI